MHKIYVVGDSHTQVFQGNSGINGPANGDNDFNLGVYKERFKVCHLGPYTAYSVYDKISFVDAAIFDINKEEDFLFFSFGEIDCRHHIGFHRDKQNVSTESAVQTCVSRYVNFLKHYKEKGYKVGVWSPIASGPNANRAGTGHATYKGVFERNHLTVLFNLYLLIECQKHSIIYKSIWDQMSHNLNTDVSYFRDGIHLFCVAAAPLIIEEFKDIL